MADFTFNGYRIDLRGGGSYAANLTGIHNNAYLNEGDYHVAPSDTPFRFSTDVPGPRQTVCQPLRQTLDQSNLFIMRPTNLLYSPLIYQSYLYDFHPTPVLGIQVEQGFFYCLERSQLFSRAREYSLQIRYAAPWMKTALQELGQREVAGSAANPRILDYFQSSRFWGTDDSGAANAWCASFVSWVMEQHGYAPPANAFRARAWENFGAAISEPVYGAIGVKSRTGGGHVAFVVGKSSDDQYLYMLGGNQSDEVNISRYPKNVWNKFVVPSGYDATLDSLPIYNKTASSAGRED